MEHYWELEAERGGKGLVLEALGYNRTLHLVILYQDPYNDDKDPMWLVIGTQTFLIT